MKITMEVKYKKKRYEDIEDALLVAAIDGIKETMKENLAPFENEIQREGGNVIIKIDGESLETLGGQMRITNISEELKTKIETHLKA
jgi:hypothetical protein